MFKKCIFLTVRELLDDFDQNQVSQKILPMIFYDEKALNIALDNIKEYEDLIVQLGGYSLKKPVITEKERKPRPQFSDGKQGVVGKPDLRKPAIFIFLIKP